MSARGELERLEQRIDAYLRGETSHAELKAFRVPEGIYEQRHEGRFMLRVRLPAGRLLPDQMRVLAAAAEHHGDGVLHVTTRQDVQIHMVRLEKVSAVLFDLLEAGLSTKGGGGNTVRNITVCELAGVCPYEAFDVGPFAEEMTESLLADPLSSRLPRKYKIAFSGCSKDCAGALVNDLGFIAKDEGEGGAFSVYVGGGLGSQAAVGRRLEELVPADDAARVAHAVKQVFDRNGNRRSKDRARLRFLLREIGFERFRELYRDARAEPGGPGPVGASRGALALRTTKRPPKPPARAEGFEEWLRRNVLRQKQDGRHIVHIPLPLGDVSSDALRRLATVVERYGEGAARATQSQNLLLRWIGEQDLPFLYRELMEAGLAGAPKPVLRNIVACAGAATCKLGICRSRGLAVAVADRIASAGLDLPDGEDLRIHISGCPNSCGRHPVASIGLFGAARRVGGALVPHYVAQIGGRTHEEETRLARGKRAVPASNVPALIVDLLGEFRRSGAYPDFGAFAEGGGEAVLDELALRHEELPPRSEEPARYRDLGAEEDFSLAGRGPGECGAGVFDLIEVDLASASEAARAGRLLEATVHASRALLVTRGLEARSEGEALRLFKEWLIGHDMVPEERARLVDDALRSVGRPDPTDAFSAGSEEVGAFIEEVEGLYARLDSSLRFRPADPEGGRRDGAEEPASGDDQSPAAAGEAAPLFHREVDLSGVVCPLNYVRTRMSLDAMEAGQVLRVRLDEQGARNVPESAERDGHQILAKGREAGAWQVLIRKR